MNVTKMFSIGGINCHVELFLKLFITVHFYLPNNLASEKTEENALLVKCKGVFICSKCTVYSNLLIITGHELKKIPLQAIKYVDSK